CSRNAYVNIMDNMQYKRAIAETRIDYARSDDEQKVTVESISVEVVNICHGIKNAWEMIEISRRRFELYNSQLEIEKLKAEMGESRRYDLVEKEIEWSRAAVALVDSKIKYLTAVSALEIATGSDPDFVKNFLPVRMED
ncbi:MAG TPA: TolC family protein, partial [Spirochaetota bacterium]|nr:TolC family protein [Spirochaetota bacterium]